MGKMIRIVATGDSMTQSAGAGCPALAAELAKEYPDKEFEIINQGVGGTRAGYGLWRMTNEYEFEKEKLPPLVSLNPDVVILESFAYNNATDGLLNDEGIEHFRDMHYKMVETIREKTDAIIIFVVTIAPDVNHFLENIPCFYNTPKSILRSMAEERMRYLEEAIQIAGELELPLVNVYAETLAAKESGTPLGTFINPEDCIHPGPKGHELTARLTVEVMKRHNLIK